MKKAGISREHNFKLSSGFGEGAEEDWNMLQHISGFMNMVGHGRRTKESKWIQL